ncbi:MAG: aspartate kinase [Actinomycetota bacterium]|jgi:aspartate kinase|nr:aspartate kinase [Actinomycetota bacterium]
MALIVQKYGGTSVETPERIKRVAERVVAAADSGQRVCVVVSAMGHTTDELVELAAQISPAPHARELDMLLSAGERISMALLSMAINELGREAISFTGSQAGIVTDTVHGKARIVDVRAKRVLEALDLNKVVIIAGFQGVSTSFDVTTLGRGGSDTTAVALAAALGADACEIYTDVKGVYTADPRLVPEARKLHAVSYEEMLELSASGAKVLMLRSVEYARNYGVLIHVRSSFDDEEGTWVRKEDSRMEQAIISGIAHDTSEAKVTVKGVPDQPGIAARVFRPLADESVNIDMIVQNSSEDGTTDIFFTVPKDDLRRAEPILQKIATDVGAVGIETDSSIAKISLVGAGMKTHPGVAADMFDALADAGINIEIISTSSIRISCVIAASEVDRAVQAIHDTFELSQGAVLREEHPETATGQLEALRADGKPLETK